jgi:TP901 family phage tail tape measure protein
MPLRVAELETLFTANVADFDKGAAKVDAKTKTLSKSDPVVKVTADPKSALTDMDKVLAESKKIDQTTATATVKADTTQARAAMTDVGQVMLTAGAVVGAGIGLAVSKFSAFDKAMSQAQAGTMATGKALDSLRAAAIEGGQATQFSASEAANAITEMGKAGVSTKDILGGGLKGALSLAAAGELEVGRAGEIAATAMNQFGLTGKDLPHVADLMAAGAGKAMGSVDDLANALKYVGPVAKNLNVSIEETTGVIAELAAQGVIGEQAGTSLRGMLLSLTSPSKLASATMADLGINVYNSQGKFIGMAGVAGELQDKLGGLNDATRNEALGRIFGNEQITAATILYQGGAKAVQDWTTKVNDSGFAARQAAMLTDNLSGDMERLGGSIDTALIQTGSGANAVLRTMAQNTEGVVNVLGAMNPTALTTGLVILSALAAVSLLGGGLLVLAPKVAATKEALDLLSASHKTTGNVIKGIGVAAGAAAAALAIGAIAFGIWAQKQADATARTAEFTATLDALGKRTDQTVQKINDVLSKDRSSMLERLFGQDSRSLIDDAKKYGLAIGDLQGYILGSADSITKVNAATKAYVGDEFNNASRRRQGAVNGFTGALGEQATALTEAEKQAGQKAVADAAAGVAQDGLTTTTKVATRAIVAQTDALQDLIDGHTTQTNILLGERDAQRGLEQAVDDASKSFVDNGATLDINTDAGRRNQSALDAIASSGWAVIDSMKQNGATQDELKVKMGETRDRFIEAATQFGLTREQADALATSLHLIPNDVSTTARISTSDALAKVAEAQAAYDGLGRPIVTTVTMNDTAVRATFAGLMRDLRGSATVPFTFGARGYSDGGYVQPLADGGAPGRVAFALAAGGPVPAPPGMRARFGSVRLLVGV